MRSSTWRRGAALVVAFGLVAAACGDDDDGGGTADTTAVAETTVAETTAAPDTTAEESTDTTAGETTETTEADDTEGLDPSTLGQSPDNPDLYVGAGGFEVDVTQCPGDWDINQGITDEEIKLFISLPQSGPLAGFGLIYEGAKVWFDYLSEQGELGGRTIVYDAKDDAYDPGRTKTNVDEALQSGEYAALVTVLGTPHNLAVWDDTNAECMPQLLNGTGAAQWGDVENHPWTTGMQIDYFTEAQLWAEWIEEEFPDGASVAAITFNNDFGKSYSAGFKAAIEGTNIELVAEELHDPTAPNLTNQITTLAATEADVLLIQTSGVFCTQAMGEIEKGAWKPTVIMSATCASLGQFFKPLIDQGLTGKDTHLIQTFKDVNDPEWAEDEFVKLYRELTEAAGLDPNQSTYATGFIFAYYMGEILKLADQMNGGLNRANIMAAARSIDVEMPLLLPGLRGRMVGLEDAYLTEGGRMVKYTVTDPAQFGTFEPVSALIDLEGRLGTYASVLEAQGG